MPLYLSSTKAHSCHVDFSPPSKTGAQRLTTPSKSYIAEDFSLRPRTSVRLHKQAPSA